MVVCLSRNDDDEEHDVEDDENQLPHTLCVFYSGERNWENCRKIWHCKELLRMY